MASLDLTSARRDQLAQKLKSHGLRTTMPRLQLADLLFAKGNRHLTADMLYAEARAAGLSVSQATIYNTLNQFSEAGLLREVQVDKTRSYYDTNLDAHHHFYVVKDGLLIDIERDAVALAKTPQTPDGFCVTGVDIVIRLESK